VAKASVDRPDRRESPGAEGLARHLARQRDSVVALPGAIRIVLLGYPPLEYHRERAADFHGERIADAVARFGGSWNFIISFAIVLVTYSSLNIFLKGRAWDPYPFILLNLFLSMLAAIQAPVIMMSQNRQDTKDRLRSELDFDVNRRAESEIQALSQKLNLIADKIGDVEDLVRANRSLATGPTASTANS